jgi:hypothetical protein
MVDKLWQSWTRMKNILHRKKLELARNCIVWKDFGTGQDPAGFHILLDPAGFHTEIVISLYAPIVICPYAHMPICR